MTYVSLFSGIEAATVAWGPLGWEPVCFAELDEFPGAVLAHRYPGVPNAGDVTKVNWKRYRDRCDLVVGGSPCQSFSVAGKREGLKGESGLMFEYVRAIREIRPRWFLWENVPGALSSEGGEAFRQLLSEMDKLGYGLAWRVLDAQFFGVAQRRRRLFLVGRLGACPPVGVLVEPESLRGDTTSSREERARLAAEAGRSPQSAGFKYHQGAGAGGIGCESEQSPTLTADYHNPAVFGFAQNTRDEVRVQGDGSVSGALAANPGMKQTTYVCETAHTGANGLGVSESDTFPTLDTNNSGAVAIPINEMVATRGGRLGRGTGFGVGEDGEPANTITRSHPHAVATEPYSMADLCAGTSVERGITGTLHCAGDPASVATSMCVRRLTPKECERLQGFPDDWTRIPYRGKPAGECPDTPRYKAIGNSMAVPVMRWIGERIGMADEEA